MLTTLLVVGVLAIHVPAAAGAQTPSVDTFVNSAENRFRTGDYDGALADLTQAIRLDPKNVKAFTYRAYIRMLKRDVDGAIADYTQVIALEPRNPGSYAYRAGLKYQKGESDAAIADATRAVTLDPKVFLGYKTLVVVYVARARSPAQKSDDVANGIMAANAALGLQPDDFEVIVYKSVLLRLKANLETDTAQQQALVSQAADLMKRAQELRQSGVTSDQSPSLPPPPPPAPPPSPGPAAPAAPASRFSSAPVRVGGNIRPPRKTKNVEPVYPEIALKAKIQGDVILEAVIDERGRVTDVKTLKSIPLLDQAAIDAVRQWEYEPTYANNSPVSIVMTVSVSFTLK